MTRCHCGQPLHYTSPDLERKVSALVAQHGEYVPISVGGRAWLVQRHYLALHGLKASELPTLGFEEIRSDPTH